MHTLPIFVVFIVAFLVIVGLKTHPDYGGNARDFDAVIQAKKLVDRFPHVV